MTAPGTLRGFSLGTRLALAFTAILLLAAIAQTILYFRTRDDTLREAEASYQSLADAIQVAATQIGPEGWKDQRVLEDYTEKLRAQGLREIRVTEGGRPFPDPLPTPAAGKKKKPIAPRDILISGVVGEGEGNKTLRLPLVVEGRLLGFIEIKYSLENIRLQLADNFRRRLYALLGVFALGLAILLVLTRNLTRPLDDLADGAARVGAGDLDVQVPVDRDDEVGRLAATFNRMTAALKERQELESRLVAAEKRAEIGHLASGLAHEIKNPLNALSLGLDVLKRRHRPPDEAAAADWQARVESLREEIDRLAGLVNSFLAYGRPMALTLAPVDVRSLVESTLFDLGETAARAHVDVDTRLPDSAPRARADGGLVKSAVWNLVQNAVQSMESTGGRLAVSLAHESASGDGGGRLVLVVEDEGAGIASADLPRLFEPWFSRREGGVGLGLAMVKRIVEEHGGSVRAGGREDGRPGARFTMTLPVDGPAPATPPPGPVRAAA